MTCPFEVTGLPDLGIETPWRTHCGWDARRRALRAATHPVVASDEPTKVTP